MRLRSRRVQTVHVARPRSRRRVRRGRGAAHRDQRQVPSRAASSEELAAAGLPRSPSGGPTPPATSRCRSRSSADAVSPSAPRTRGRRRPPREPTTRTVTARPRSHRPEGLTRRADAVGRPGAGRCRPRWSTRTTRSAGATESFRATGSTPTVRSSSGTTENVGRARGTPAPRTRRSRRRARSAPGTARTAPPRRRSRARGTRRGTSARRTRQEHPPLVVGPEAHVEARVRGPRLAGRRRRRCRPSAPGTPRTRCRLPVSSARSTSGWKPIESRSTSRDAQVLHGPGARRGRHFRGCRRRWSRHHPDHQQHEEARDVRLIVRTTHERRGALPRSARHPCEPAPLGSGGAVPPDARRRGARRS